MARRFRITACELTASMPVLSLLGSELWAIDPNDGSTASNDGSVLMSFEAIEPQ